MKIINLKGDILKASGFFWEEEEELINLKTVKEALGNVKDDIFVNLTTNGGGIYEAINIYNYIKEWKVINKKKASVFINGLVASAGVYIAMAFDDIIVSNSSTLMVHSARVGVFGNSNDLKEAAEKLDKVSQIMVDEFIARTGIDKATVDEYFSKDTYFTGKEIIELGFATVFDNENNSLANSDITNKASFNPEAYLNSLAREKLLNNVNNHANMTVSNKANSDEKEHKMNLEELRLNHPEIFNQIKDQGKKEAYNIVQSHLDWLEQGADINDVVSAIKNQEIFNSTHVSKYSMAVMRKAKHGEIVNDLAEEPAVKTPKEEDIVATVKEPSLQDEVKNFADSL